MDRIALMVHTGILTMVGLWKTPMAIIEIQLSDELAETGSQCRPVVGQRQSVAVGG
jgi:hypothetical protein